MLSSQLIINGISKVLQKILRYFNGTIILTSFVLQCFLNYLFVYFLFHLCSSNWRTIFKYLIFSIIRGCCFPLLGTVVDPLTSIYEPLKWHKLDLNIVVLNLVWLLVLYVPRESLFILSQFFILNLDGWFPLLSKKLFWYFIIILLY